MVFYVAGRRLQDEGWSIWRHVTDGLCKAHRHNLSICIGTEGLEIEPTMS